MEMLIMITCTQNHLSSSTEGEMVMINGNALLNKEANENGGKPEIMQIMLVEQ